MSGPLPKPPSRRRRSTGSHWISLPAREVLVPEPPGPLSAHRLAWWREMWESPISTGWLEVDATALYRLAKLLDLAEPSGALLAEIRQLEDRFGLSPVARRKLGHEVARLADMPDADEPERDDGDRFARALKPV